MINADCVCVCIIMCLLRMFTIDRWKFYRLCECVSVWVFDMYRRHLDFNTSSACLKYRHLYAITPSGNGISLNGPSMAIGLQTFPVTVVDQAQLSSSTAAAVCISTVCCCFRK